ncbi:helix-turn-helix transcriptional regulator [Streptomyces blastmyceticus]|uniref:Helix-turn-helix transcriptional regulator n=1 Tax=Streptomyces blastmyceticus TaxID=68180 RepID=A0ABN0WFX0_9ACTN
MAAAAPTVLRRRLGAMLKTMRLRAGYNLAEASELLGLFGPPALSKIESGRQRPDLERFFSVYQVTDAAHIAETREIAKLAISSRQKTLFAQYKDVIRPAFADFIELEEVATRTDSYVATAIPGLLQTAEYAQAIIEGANVWNAARTMRAFAELRMKRQDLLTLTPGTDDDRAPISLRYVLDEACLRREVGGPGVLREELHHLVTVSKQSNVELRVLPFKAGAHPGVDGSYTVFHFEVGEPVVAVESLTDSLYLEEDLHVARYAAAFDRLRAQALEPDESRDFIAGIAKETL